MEKIIVFGAGQIARTFINQMDAEQYSISEVWDNRLHGNKLYEYDILKPHTYNDFKGDIDKVFLAVGRPFQEEIKEQCLALGIPEEIIEYYKEDFDEIINNVQKTDYTKKALFIFIKTPFQTKEGDPINHINFYEAKAIVSALSKLEYEVDVMDYRSNREIDFGGYDLIIGLGEQYDCSLKMNDFEKKQRILYATGASILHSAVAAIERSKALYKRRGIYKEPERAEKTSDFDRKLQSISLSDGILLVGNDWTKSTYEKLNNNIYKVGAIGFNSYCMEDISRNIGVARKNFICFTGYGMVHKGLDLCIEAFAQMPEYHLYIVGKRDEDFEKIYSDELKLDNIHMMGFINTASEEYREICESCCYTLCFSCSEGICTSIATTMYMGMIPIVAKTAGIDVEDFGYELDNCEVSDIVKAIRSAEGVTDDELMIKCKKAYEYAKKYYNKEVFEEKVYSGISNIVDKNK